MDHNDFVVLYGHFEARFVVKTLLLSESVYFLYSIKSTLIIIDSKDYDWYSARIPMQEIDNKSDG